jgi:hypothetical protein
MSALDPSVLGYGLATAGTVMGPIALTHGLTRRRLARQVA